MTNENHRKRNLITEALADTCQLHGYTRIFPETLDDPIPSESFYERSVKKTLKFIDGGANVRLLHEDPTLSLFKAMVEAELPDTVFYTTRGYEPLPTATERLKGGAERFGPPSRYSDLEMLTMACRFVESLPVDTYYLEVGDSKILKGILAAYTEDVRIRRKLYDAVHRKSKHDLEDLLDPAHPLAPLLLDLPKAFGTPDEILPTFRKALADEADLLASLDAFEERIRLFMGTPYAKHLTIDFSMTSKYSYYDGILFKLFGANYTMHLVTGGRYHIQYNGRDVHGIGFGFDYETLQGGLTMNAKNTLSNDFTIMTTADDLGRIIRLGDELRKAGFTVENVERELSADTIKNTKSRYILAIENEDVKIVNNLQNTFDRTPYERFIEQIPFFGDQESRH